jgi:hypothetical protein
LSSASDVDFRIVGEARRGRSSAVPPVPNISYERNPFVRCDRYGASPLAATDGQFQGQAAYRNKSTTSNSRPMPLKPIVKSSNKYVKNANIKFCRQTPGSWLHLKPLQVRLLLALASGQCNVSSTLCGPNIRQDIGSPTRLSTAGSIHHSSALLSTVRNFSRFGYPNP